MSREYIECDACQASAPSKTCSKCHMVYYCSAECQREHWKTHKPDCHLRDKILRGIAEQQAEQAANDTNEAATAVNSDVDDTCGICLEDMNPSRRMSLPCGHTFCYACLKEYQESAAFSFHQATGSSYINEASCPYCRAQIKDNVDSVVIDHAHLLISRANRQGKSEPAVAAARELQKVLDVEPDDITALCVLADAHCASGTPDQAVKEILRVIEIDSGSYQDSETKKFRIGGHGPARLFAINLKLADAHMKNRDWNAAKDVYMSMLVVMDDPSVGTAPQQRQVFMGMARCAYHSKCYKQSIFGCETSILMNRHFPDVHKYMFLSQRDMGDLEAARATLNRAVLYEALWDVEHQSKMKKLLEDFNSEHGEVQA